MMELVTFFEAVLPPKGPYAYAWFENKKQKGTTHASSIEELAEECLKMNAMGYDVYYRTCAYKQRKGGYKEDNFRERASYHLDIDIGPGKDYATPQEAAADLIAAIQKYGLPNPMIVSSGNGMHVYWMLSESVNIDVWRPTAEKLKSAMLDAGLKLDAKLTTNPVCLLRPIGTLNRKYEPKPVRVLKQAAGKLTQAAFDAYLPADSDPLAGELSELANMFAPSDDMSVTREYDPSDADGVASTCAFIHEFKATGFGGGGKEPQWHDAIGVVKHCIDGEAKCHEYSSVAENYDEGSTQDKIDQWDKGPTTCVHVSNNYGYCEGCQYKGRVTSPIQLGVKAAAIEEIMSQGDVVEGPWWPKGTGWDEARHQMYITHHTQNSEGEWVDERQYFSSTKFYVETRIWTDDNTWAFRVHRLKYTKVLDDGAKQDIWETFTVPTKEVARPADLSTTFAAQEVYVASRTGAGNLSDLLKSYGDALRLRQVETKTHAVMGWYARNENQDMHTPTYPLQADSFIVGNRLITKDGEEQVLLGDKVKPKWRNGFGVAGTPAEWARTIHKYYVETNAIPYQFIILTEFAAPLVSLFCRSEYHGNPIIISGESGWAKTTTCAVALSIWGNPDLFKVSGNPKAGATAMSFMKTLSVLRHMSPLLDEVTKQQPHVVGEMIYAIAMGESRERLDNKGNPIPTESPWSSITKITSNNPIMQRVLEDETDTENAGDAIQKRIFEVNLDRLPYNREEYVADKDIGAAIHKFLGRNYGTIGPLWIRYVLNNLDEIVGDLDKAYLDCKYKALDHAGERFHDYFEAAMLVAAKHVSRAQLMFPDAKGIEQFIADVRADMSSIRDDSKVPMLDLFSRFLGMNQGGLLITDRFPTGKGRPDHQEFPKRDLHGELVGRIAMKDQVAAIALSPLKDWCKNRGADFSRLVSELDKNGYFAHDPAALKANGNKPEPLKTATARLNLGRGTSVIHARAQCLLLDFGRIANKAHLRTVTEENNAAEI